MKKLIEDNYSSIVARGLIHAATTKDEFVNKLWEECEEFTEVFNKTGMIDAEELADVILVCLNIAKHYNIDIEKEMRGKISVNFNRAKNGE
jgi:NTP pyrophosphatase (non-canonical NTP hydrolase)